MVDPSTTVSTPDNNLGAIMRFLKQSDLTLSGLLSLWSSTEEIQYYLSLIAQQPDNPPTQLDFNNDTISESQITQFLKEYYEKLSALVISGTSELAPHPNLRQEIQNAISGFLPSTTVEQVLWLNDKVQIISSLLQSYKPSPQQTAHRKTRGLFPKEEAIIDLPLTSETDSTTNSAKVVVPSTNSSSAPEAEIPLASPSVLQTLVIHNAFARNEIALHLAQEFQNAGINLPKGNPWGYLTPETQYKISQALDGFLFTLEDEELKRINRHEVARKIYEKLISTRPELRDANQVFAPSALESNIPTSANESTAESTTPAQSQVSQTEAEQAFNNLKTKATNGYFSADAEQIKNDLLAKLQEKGVPSYQAISLINFVSNTSASREDLKAVLYGLQTQQIKTIFPFLATLADEDLREIVNEVYLYGLRSQGLISKIAEYDEIVLPVGELPETETLHRTNELLFPEPGSLADNSTKERLDNLLDIAHTQTPADDHYNGQLQTLALSARPGELMNPNHPVAQKAYAKFLEPVYKSQVDAIAALEKITNYQLRIIDAGASYIGKDQFTDFREKLSNLNAQYQADNTFIELRTTTTRWNQYLANTTLGRYWQEAPQVLANIRPTDYIETLYQHIRQRNSLPGASNLNRQSLAQQMWSSITRSPTLRTAQTVQTVNRAKFLSKLLINAKKITVSTKRLFSVTRLAILAKGIIASIINSPVVAVVLPVLGVILAILPVINLVVGVVNGVTGLVSSITSPLKASVQNAFTSSTATNSSATGGSTSLIGQNVLANAAKMAQNVLLPTTPIGAATLSVTTMGSIILVSMGGLQAAFYKPLTLQSQISNFIDMEKTATINGSQTTKLNSVSNNTVITYTITIKPKDNYVLTLSSFEDQQFIRFNEDKLNKDGRSVPLIEGKQRSYNVTTDTGDSEISDDLNSWSSKPTLNPGETITITYQETVGSEYQDSNLNNTFRVMFDYLDPSTNESGTNEVATIEHSLCFGECPRAGGGCWPMLGKITQLPFNMPRFDSSTAGSHEAGVLVRLGDDAFDIGAPAGTEIRAPFSARICARPYNGDGYGTYLVMDQIPGADYHLIFAHMSETIFGSNQSACQTVQVGQVMGLSGSSGNVTGPHLHYGLGPAITTGNSRLKNIVPNGSTVAVNDRLETGLCQLSGS